MSDTQRAPGLRERVEAEREATDAVVACPWSIHEEFLRRKAVMAAARAATDEAVRAVEALAYAPGDWICDHCSYVESKRTFNVTDGGVRVDTVSALPCPNDGESMRRLTWREIAKAWQDATPTPARSEAAGGEEVTRESVRVAVLNDPKMHAAYTVGRIEEHDRMQREMDDLRQQLAAAREDGERLDWMQEHYAEIGWLVPNSDPAVCEVWETHEGVRVVASWAASGDGPDLRSAIDAARTEPAREGEGGHAE